MEACEREDDGDDRRGPDGHAALDRVADVIRRDADRSGPAGRARDVPEKETPPRHVDDARHPAKRRTNEGNEASEVERLGSVASEQLLRALERRSNEPVDAGTAREELASEHSPEGVAGRRPENGCDDRPADEPPDVAVPSTRESRRDDECGLARNEESTCGFEKDEPDDDPDAVVRNELGHPISLELPAMRVGVARETAPGERRVALVPETVGKLAAAGFDVVVETGAGDAASFPDTAYVEAGITLGSPWEADAVVAVRRPDAARLRDGQLLIGFLDPLSDPAGVEALAARGVVAFAMESIPRITRAQSMDALSSQATVGGYKAGLLAADHLPRFFPMLMTAAGTVPPAKVLVIGAGVAGLQAIATARRLGAVVTGFDVRPVVREQIESLGANWLDLGVTGAEAEGGYARELTQEEMQAQQAALEARIAEFDAVITTAAVPGRVAPKIIPASAVQAMRPGSVIVDLAADTGGNCELTVPGEVAVREGVTLVGLTNLPSTMPYHASMLYSRNVQALLLHLAPEGQLNLDWDDEITKGACVTRKAVTA